MAPPNEEAKPAASAPAEEAKAAEPEVVPGLSTDELKHISSMWNCYRPTSRQQAGNTTFLKSEINDTNPATLHGCYNSWQLKLQIDWLSDYRGQRVAATGNKEQLINLWIDLVKAKMPASAEATAPAEEAKAEETSVVAPPADEAPPSADAPAAGPVFVEELPPLVRYRDAQLDGMVTGGQIKPEQAARYKELRRFKRQNKPKDNSAVERHTLYADRLRELDELDRTITKATSTAATTRIESMLTRVDDRTEAIEKQVAEMHTVMIKGESIGGSGIARKAQIRLAKASLTTEFQAASSASKDEMNDLMQAQLDRMRQLKAESVDARLAALSGDETLLLSLAPLFAEAKANAKAMAKAAAKRVADAKAAAKRVAVAKPQQRTLDAGFDVD